MKREDWLRLTPRERFAHRLQRQIERLEKLKAQYDRDRASGKIAEPIDFFEPTDHDEIRRT
jgi:hypothetical protein